MSTNHTTNYDLNQWEGTDKVLRTDFNEDNSKIDAALKGLADKDTALEAMVAAATAAAGNCEMELITYTGTGTYGNSNNGTKIQFQAIPDIFIIVGDKSVLFGRGGVSSVVIASEDFLSNDSVTWSGSLFTFSNGIAARYQMNSKNMPYWVLGLKRKI